jgi:hypothetical protein
MRLFIILLLPLVSLNSFAKPMYGGGYQKVYDPSGVFVRFQLPQGGNCSGTRVGDKKIDGQEYYIIMTATHCFCTKGSNPNGLLGFSKEDGAPFNKVSLKTADVKLVCQNCKGDLLNNEDCRSTAKGVSSCLDSRSKRGDMYNDVGFMLVPKEKFPIANPAVKYPKVDCSNPFSKAKMDNCQFQGLAYGTQSRSGSGKKGVGGTLQYGHIPINDKSKTSLQVKRELKADRPYYGRYISYETYVYGYNKGTKVDGVRSFIDEEKLSSRKYKEGSVTLNPGDSGSPLICSDKVLFDSDGGTFPNSESKYVKGDIDYSHMNIVGTASYFAQYPLSDEEQKKYNESFSKVAVYNRLSEREKIFDAVFEGAYNTNLNQNCVSNSFKSNESNQKAFTQE